MQKNTRLEESQFHILQFHYRPYLPMQEKIYKLLNQWMRSNIEADLTITTTPHSLNYEMWMCLWDERVASVSPNAHNLWLSVITKCTLSCWDLLLIESPSQRYECGQGDINNWPRSAWVLKCNCYSWCICFVIQAHIIDWVHYKFKAIVMYESL